MEPVEILRHLDGSASREQILASSSRWALERAITHGAVERVSRGRYALPELPEPIKTAASQDGVLSHASAAQYWLMDAVCRPDRVHVTVPRHSHRRAQKLVVLHYADRDDERVTSPGRTVLDCARTMPFRESLAIADSALRRELISAYDLASAAEALTGPGSRRARRVVALADARAANPFESALRATVIDARLEGFLPQLGIPGTEYRVDLGDPKRMIVLEADSFEFHGKRSALERDCRRYDELVRRGWLVLRFSWEQVMFDEQWVASVITDCGRLRNNRRAGTKARKTC
jgi:very-short-patch-repair endonuclease